MLTLPFLGLNPEVTASSVLDHVRAALHIGTKASWREATLSGSAMYRGCSGSFTLRFRPEGEFAARFKGPLMDGWGFDGQTTWKLDPVGFPHRQLMKDASQEQAIASFLTNRWLRAGALSSAILISRENDTVTLLINQWDSKIPEKVVVDSTTWIPKSASIHVHAGSVDLQVQKWGEVGTERVPFESTANELGEITRLTVSSARPADSASGDAYAMPSALPNDHRYDSAVGPALESKSIYGHLFVHPRVDGKDVGWFIFDTCAEVQMIDAAVANKAGLKKVGGTAITGIGGTVIEPYRMAKTFTLGPAEIDGAIFSELDASFLTKAFGIPVAGIVGADFLERYVVSVNVEKPEITVYDRSDYQLPGGEWTPLAFFGGNPAVRGEYDGGRQGWFELDTGAGDGVMVCSPTVRAEHLLDGRSTQSGAIGGFGGQSATATGKMDYLTIGGRKFEGVDAAFSLADTGALANEDVAGVVGESLMKPFTIVFDFAGYRIAFLPRSS